MAQGVKKPQPLGTKAVKRPRLVAELCKVAVLNVPESPGVFCVEPVGSFGLK